MPHEHGASNRNACPRVSRRKTLENNFFGQANAEMTVFANDAVNFSKKEGHVQISDVEEHSQTSDNTDEQPNQTLASRLLNAIERYWLFELFGWILALACFIGIVSLLAVHNGKESPNWTVNVGAGHYRKSFGLTINTIISLFATAFNSGLLIPVAASVSQLKWIWFQRGRRPLAHFQKFESAARGPLGSLILLWTLRGRYVITSNKFHRSEILTANSGGLPA